MEAASGEYGDWITTLVAASRNGKSTQWTSREATPPALAGPESGEDLYNPRQHPRGLTSSCDISHGTRRVQAIAIHFELNFSG